MIGYLEGSLLKKDEDRILLLVNHVGYEVLLPASIMEKIMSMDLGDPLSFHIYHHQTERQPKPVLIGFSEEAEREFFQYFISVEDIGPLKALKAMNIPIVRIAEAIEQGDAAGLKQLKGIGNRTAQKIIASLQGKVGKFAAPGTEEGGAGIPAGMEAFSKPVMDVLVNQLGHKHKEARRMISEALERNPDISEPEALFDEIYRGERKE